MEQFSLPSGAESGPALSSPSKSVCHDSHTEGAHHAAHAKDGYSDAPDDGADPWADGLLVAFHPGVVEEGS